MLELYSATLQRWGTGPSGTPTPACFGRALPVFRLARRIAGSRCKPVVSVYDSDTNSRTQQDKPGESSSIKQTLADLDALLGIEEEKPKIEPQVGGV
jgi:hypothetical protein